MFTILWHLLCLSCLLFPQSISPIKTTKWVPILNIKLEIQQFKTREMKLKNYFGSNWANNGPIFDTNSVGTTTLVIIINQLVLGVVVV